MRINSLQEKLTKSLLPELLEVNLHQVIDLLKEDYTDDEIAQELDIEPIMVAVIRETNFLY